MDPMMMALLAALGGSLGQGLFGGSGQYEQLPGTSPGDYGLIDPGGFSQGSYDQLMGGMANFGNLQNSFMQQLGQWDPQGGMNAFLGQAPELQQLVSGQMSDLEGEMRGRTAQNIREGIDTGAGQMSGLGSMYSSAFMDTAGRRATEASRDASIAMNQQQLGLTGQLWGQGMNMAGQGNLAQGNILSSLLGQSMGGQTSILGSLAGFGAPNYAAPQYEYQPGILESLFGSLAGMAPSMIPGTEK